MASRLLTRVLESGALKPGSSWGGSLARATVGIGRAVVGSTIGAEVPQGSTSSGGATLALEAGGALGIIPRAPRTEGRALVPAPRPPVPSTVVTRPQGDPFEALVPTMPFDFPIPIPPTSSGKAGGGRPGQGGLVDRGLDILDRIVNRGGGGNGNTLVATQCPPGYTRIGTTCVDPTAAAPGGRPLTMQATGAGSAVMGIFGAPAVEAQVVGEITRENGSTGLVRRCPSGTVLGKDNLCYAKGSIPNKLRKWPKTARPPVSAYDARMMRKYGPGGSKQKGIKRLATDAGFTCKKR